MMSPQTFGSPFELTGSSSAGCNWWDLNCILQSHGLPALPPSVATPFTPWTGPPGQPNPYMPGGGKVLGGTAPSWLQSMGFTSGAAFFGTIGAVIVAGGGLLIGLYLMAGAPEPRAVPVPV